MPVASLRPGEKVALVLSRTTTGIAEEIDERCCRVRWDHSPDSLDVVFVRQLVVIHIAGAPRLAAADYDFDPHRLPLLTQRHKGAGGLLVCRVCRNETPDIALLCHDCREKFGGERDNMAEARLVHYRRRWSGDICARPRMHAKTTRRANAAALLLAFLRRDVEIAPDRPGTSVIMDIGTPKAYAIPTDAVWQRAMEVRL